MINLWRQIETLPPGDEPFLGDKSVKNGTYSGGALMRRHADGFEQFVNGEWHPAFFRPKYWKRAAVSNGQ